MGQEWWGEESFAVDLTVPEFGRAYLKAALNQNDEEIFSQALKAIRISFLVQEQAENGNKIACVLACTI